MDTGELRKQILRALDEARRTSSVRRRTKDEAAQTFELFLTEVAGPLFRQAVTVLRAEGQAFEVQTPAHRVRLVNDGAPHTFLEIELDTSTGEPQAVGRVSITRGRSGVIVEERPIAANTPVAQLSEADLSAFLVAEIPKLVVS